MGKFFNERIRNMPNSEVRRLKKSTLVKINPVYGQTKGYLEELRKEFNKSGEPVCSEENTETSTLSTDGANEEKPVISNPVLQDRPKRAKRHRKTGTRKARSN